MTAISIALIGLTIALITFSTVALIRAIRAGFTRRRVAIFILALGLLFIVYLAYNLGKIEPADWAQIMLMLGLVSVTGIYALSAARQADASVKMAEEMREQRYDTVRPVIDIQREESPETQISEALASDSGDTSRGLSCILNNIGLGPAIDVHSLVQPPWAPWGQSQHHDFGTLAIGRQTKINLSLEQEDNRTALVVYYKDVYGRAFESSREVRAGKKSEGWQVGPLQIRSIEEGMGNDS